MGNGWEIKEFNPVFLDWESWLIKAPNAISCRESLSHA